MKIAVQEDMLPGRTLHDKLFYARDIGVQGVEFQSFGLTERVPQIVEALHTAGLAASAVNMGRRDGFLYPERSERERAIGEMRQAMADAVDMGASAVVFMPHYGSSKQPDLTPFKSPVEIEIELFIWLLRTVEDLAYAIGVELYMQPVNRYESHFLNRLEQAIRFRREIKDHPHVKIAANLFHMALEEANPIQSLREALPDIGQIYFSDSNHRLPGQGLLDFSGVMAMLKEGSYTGWLTLECITSSDDEALSTCLNFLRPMLWANSPSTTNNEQPTTNNEQLKTNN
jgi:sugar phosphate isomerase/epimerase